MKPDPQAMEQFLLHLFGNQMCGQVELAWRDAADSKVRHAQLFHLDNLDDLIARADEVNTVEGQNTYFGAALRKPDMPPFGRCSDEDVLCATAFWADLDDAEAVAGARGKSGRCPANVAVITGRHPQPRAQLFWVQEEAVTNLDTLRRQNAAIAAVLGGDPAVVNASRIMRLPGTIAWPTKTGRIAEPTELLTWPDRPAAYVEGETAAAFPPNAVKPLKMSELFDNASPPDRWIQMLQNGAAEGERNSTVAALAGYLFRRDIRPEEVRELLRCVNESRFKPPLGDDELVSVLESIAKAELKRRGKAA